MELSDYWHSLLLAEKERFAKDCGVSKGHMSNVVYGFRKASAELAIKIEKRSRGLVRREKVAPHVEW